MGGTDSAGGPVTTVTLIRSHGNIVAASSVALIFAPGGCESFAVCASPPPPRFTKI